MRRHATGCRVQCGGRCRRDHSEADRGSDSDAETDKTTHASWAKAIHGHNRCHIPDPGEIASGAITDFGPIRCAGERNQNSNKIAAKTVTPAKTPSHEARCRTEPAGRAGRRCFGCPRGRRRGWRFGTTTRHRLANPVSEPALKPASEVGWDVELQQQRRCGDGAGARRPRLSYQNSQRHQRWLN